MKIELTTELVPFINVNMYNSNISPENILTEFDEYDMLDDDEKDDENDPNDTYNNKKYEEFIYKCACKVFNEHYLPKLKTLDLSISNGKCIKLYSPKSYNYGGDTLYFDLYMNSNIKYFWNKFKSKINQDEFNEFLYNEYKSYAGFISQMPHSIYEIEKLIENNEDTFRVISVILTYELTNDDTNYQEIFMNIIENDKYLYNFFDDNIITEKIILKFNDFIYKKS